MNPQPGDLYVYANHHYLGKLHYSISGVLLVLGKGYNSDPRVRFLSDNIVQCIEFGNTGSVRVVYIYTLWLHGTVRIRGGVETKIE